MQTVDIEAAMTRLAELVDRAADGEQFMITKAGVPMARLLPPGESAQPSATGAWVESVWIAEDFDTPLPAPLLEAVGGPPGP